MTDETRHGTDEMPVFDAIEPTPGHGRASSVPSGRHQPGPARGAGAAAAVLALLVVGITVGSFSLTPGPTGSPDATIDPSTSAPPTVTPEATPLISPAVRCGTLVPKADIGVNLLVGSEISIPGSVGPRSVPAEVHAQPGDRMQIMVDGEACAVRWRIEMTNVETGDATSVDAFANPAADPAYAAQNRWTIPSLSEQQILTADLHFPGGLAIVRAWLVIVDPFVVPPLYLVGPGGARFQASDECGLYLHLTNGYEASADCGSIGYSPGAAAMNVARYKVIHLDLPGWRLTSWSANCGRVTMGDPKQFDSPGGCGLGSASSDDGGPLVDAPAFVLPPGDTVIQIGIGAIDGGGNRFNVTYYAHVIAR